MHPNGDFAPITQRPGISFRVLAGEATVWNDNPRSVHGALQSGERVAVEISAALAQVPRQLWLPVLARNSG